MRFSGNLNICMKAIIVLIFISVNQHVEALNAQDIVFVIVGQSDTYHAAKAERLKQDILNQVSSIKHGIPIISMVHEEFPRIGGWTITPTLPWLAELHGRKRLWVVFLEEKTGVNVKELINMLEQYDPNESIWMGHELFDKESTIIHHFAFAENPTEFKYPLLATGFVMSMKLIKRLGTGNIPLNSDFSIDPSYEFALFVKKPLLNLPNSFCLENRKGCATFLEKFTGCGTPVSTDMIFFAVKTCLKFHSDRVPVVQNTWGKDVKHIEFYSHHKDDNIPIIDVGVANTEQGHCAKTFSIFRIVTERARQIPTLQWLILADDDTLLSVSRLQDLLSCWNNSEPIAIGERYGYRVKDDGFGGYNYITGGGGIAISIVTLKYILQYCSCQSDDTPDDMYLGICLARLNIPIVHSPDFHQARPDDYAMDYLASQRPISFHKHWMIDPITTYKSWFDKAEEVAKHIEL